MKMNIGGMSGMYEGWELVPSFFGGDDGLNCSKATSSQHGRETLEMEACALLSILKTAVIGDVRSMKIVPREKI